MMMSWILSLFQVKCFGPGLEPFGCIINKAADFTINAQEAGRGELKLYAQVRIVRSDVLRPSLPTLTFMTCVFCCQDSDGFPIEIQLTDSGNGTYFCVYVPTKPIKYTIIITWGEINIPNSPFRVWIHQTSTSSNVDDFKLDVRSQRWSSTSSFTKSAGAASPENRK